MSGASDSGGVYVNGVLPPVTIGSGGGGDGGGDLDSGAPVWAAGMRADIRALGAEFRTGIRQQTIALLVLAVVAIGVNAGLVLYSMRLSVGSGGVAVETQRQNAP